MRASVGGAPTFFRLFLLTFTSTSGSAFNEPDGEAVAGSAFDEPDSEAVAGADDMLQLTSAVTDYLLILLLFQLYSCVVGVSVRRRLPRSNHTQNLSDHMPSDSPPLPDAPYGPRRMSKPASPYPTRHT